MAAFFYFLLLIGILVTVHEFGHFIVAKLSGVQVNIFSFGFGPKLISFKGKVTEYRISLLPLGGYVKLEGDDPSEEIPEDKKKISFLTQPYYKKFLIVIAGPVFNFIFPLFVFFFAFLFTKEVNPPVIGEIISGGPASVSGLKSGDKIVEINGSKIHTWYEMQKIVKASPGKKLNIKVLRNGKIVNLTVVPEPVTVPYIKGVYEATEGRILVMSGFVSTVVHILPDSEAQKAGLKDFDKITEINNKKVERWIDVSNLLLKLKGKTVQVKVLRGEKQKKEFVFSLQIKENPEATGIAKGDLLVYRVEDKSPAKNELGLQKGDYIVEIDGIKLSTWGGLTFYLNKKPDSEHTIVFKRGNTVFKKKFKLAKVRKKVDFKIEKEVYVFGAYNVSDNFVLPQPIKNPIPFQYAVSRTFYETGKIFKLTLYGLGGLFIGKVPLKEMGGPILIAQVAGKTSEEGWRYFLNILVWISISLGVINLVPIPVLDGGHLLLFTIELIRRKPLSMKARQAFMYVGFVFIILLTILIFSNDILRLLR